MSRCVKSFALALAFASSAIVPLGAQEVTDPEPDVHAETFAVTVNDVDVSAESIFYLEEDGTVYAAASDLAEWNLRYPQDPAFVRDGRPFYALQSTLHLAVAVVRPQERLEIIAPRTAFIGQARSERQPLTPGGGAGLNYRLRRTNGTYDFFSARNSSAFQMSYVSTQSLHSASFLRAQTRWYHLDINKHNVLQIGDGQINGGSIGYSLQFTGVHLASEFAKDPLFTTNAHPAVSGVAESPSLVEVYVDDVLQWREEVPAGPFTVRDLPASAANSDVVLVLYDRSGNRTVQVVRPSVDQELLRPGLSSYSLDAGIGRVGGTQQGGYYRDAVFSGMLRHGITTGITAQLQAQSIAGKAFGDAALQMRISSAQSATITYGYGASRRAAEFDYRLRAGRFDVHESLRYNAERTASEYDPFGYYAQLNESTELRYDTRGTLSLGLRLDRAVSNSGSPTALLSMDVGEQLGEYSFQMRPVYDNRAHLLSANLGVTRRFGAVHEVTQRVDAPADAPASAALEYRKTQRDPNDPISLDARVGANASAERRVFVEDRLPWGVANVLIQKQYGIGIIEPELYGALALVEGHVYAMPSLGGDETIGIAHTPNLSNVRIQLNGVDAGRTDKNGDLVLRNLRPFANNEITADLSNVPIAEQMRNPQVVVPYAGTPVDVTLVATSEQSVRLRIVDSSGEPLPAGSWVVAENGANFAVGFDGAVFIEGLSPGAHRLSSATSNVCSFDLIIAPRFEIVAGGTRVCGKPLQ